MRLLLSIDRREGAAAAMDTVHLAKEFMAQGVVGGVKGVAEWDGWGLRWVWREGNGAELFAPLHCCGTCWEMPARSGCQTDVETSGTALQGPPTAALVLHVAALSMRPMLVPAPCQGTLPNAPFTQ